MYNSDLMLEALKDLESSRCRYGDLGKAVLGMHFSLGSHVPMCTKGSPSPMKPKDAESVNFLLYPNSAIMHHFPLYFYPLYCPSYCTKYPAETGLQPEWPQVVIYPLLT